MKRILTIVMASLCVMLFSADASAAAKLKTVVFDTHLHCKNCAKKVMENISYVKGVKDLKVSLEKQEICVTFDEAKTSEETLAKEIKKLGYPATVKKTDDRQTRPEK